MELTDVYTLSATTILGCIIAVWLVSLVLRDASIVDIFWGVGFAIVAIVTVLQTNDGASARRGLITAMSVFWGLRLGAFLLWRSAGAGEDPRYRAMRRHWGDRFWAISLFTVFGLQGVLIWIVSQPIQLTQYAPGGPLGPLDAIGFGIWLFGMYFEGVGDLQLTRFRADPNNAEKVMNQGLWKYTRHPNYFGDACVWWGIGVVALAGPYGVFGLIGPAVMTYLLLKVSGVAKLENSIHKRRPGYAEYQQTTSSFFPRRPRSAS